MADKIYPQSQLPIRRTVEFLPNVFQTETNDKFLSAVVDPMIQPGVLEKTVGYVGRRYGKTYNSKDIYLDTDQTLRSRYQLEPGVTVKKDGKILNFYDYIDFKNQLRFFGNEIERDDLITEQDHYSWDPPIDWDKFINFREYYWVPDGPPPVKILGQSQEINSTYRVRLGVGSTFIFSPDGFTNNPSITLYRGQTYKFLVNVPDNGFTIKTSYDTGSLLYNPNLPYSKGQIVVFDGKLWKAKENILVTDGSTINEESQDWEYLEPANVASALDYTNGVTNNGAVTGTVTFKVPLNAPDVLYYQSTTDPNRFGRFVIQDIQSNTKIDIDKEIIGKTSYKSSNEIEFTNGLVVEFLGQVTPSKYATGRWLVEGVGTEIKLINFQDLVPPRLTGEYPEAVFAAKELDVENEIVGKPNFTSDNNLTLQDGMVVYFTGPIIPKRYLTDVWLVTGVGDKISLTKVSANSQTGLRDNIPEVLFDNEGFDTEPFDDASLYPRIKDYVTINRASKDSNPWSRYNRWFHKSVLTFAHNFNNSDFDAADTDRAKRPIIEFKSDLRLYNHGITAKNPIDFIDTFTKDVFSTIEGSQGYIVDGEELFEGARLLVTADTDRLANNKIYEVNFIKHQGTVFTKGDWSTSNSYRRGDIIRFNGQPYSAILDVSSINLTILSTNTTTRVFRVLKNTSIQPDMGINFGSTLFGNVAADTLYFIKTVDNENPNETLFTISETKRGTTFIPTFGASSTDPNGPKMTATAAVHPTNTSFWTPAFNRTQISLRRVDDTDSSLGECVLVKRGNKNKGLMYHFDGAMWKLSQRKTSANLSPLFDVLDENQISYGDIETYPVSSFEGTKILSYRQGNSITDPELKFSLSYLNIENVGDILFDFNWDVDTFTFEVDGVKNTKNISSGYYIFNNNNSLGNNWIKSDRKFYQPIIDSVEVTDLTKVEISAINWFQIKDTDIDKIILYINGVRYQGDYTREANVFIFPSGSISIGDIVSCRIYGNVVPDQGYYEIPLGLEKNPLNQDITNFTLGQAIDHVSTAVELNSNFIGIMPGSSNLRDLSSFSQLSRRFLKHAGVSPLALLMLADKQINIIKSLEFAGKSYRDFKNNFIQYCSILEYKEDPVSFVDDILVEMTKVKKDTDAFVDSDMIGSGGYTSIKYQVEDEGIKTFSLSQRFNLTSLSRKAVYVYVNGVQLINKLDYDFNLNFGFVELKIPLVVNDLIEIREYISTTFSYIPPTPTKLGLYKKFTPKKFVDDTYKDPVTVIRGHDGSITVGFNDFRDDVLLELERRIYNNIKKEYSTNIFDVDKIFGGYYETGIFSKDEFNSLISRQFRKWAIISRSDFVDNTYFDPDDSKTYTYNKMTNKEGTQNLLGWWRGVYLWYYDTVRPHTDPWEMLGFSDKPDWWEDEYGPAPYTSNNLILWEDIRDGIIRQGSNAGVNERYKRPSILDHLPVDADGNLLDPLESELAGNFALINASGPFKFGDVSPVEYAWRSSSDFPFAIMIACALARPFEFISENIDKNLIASNVLGQTVSTNTLQFLKLTDIVIPSPAGQQTSGLINYVVDYFRYNRFPLSVLSDKIYGLDVNLSTRLSGFVDQAQQKYLLDSKNPKSTSSGVFVPQENYDIIFNVSLPIKTLTYSAIVVEKTDKGFKVYGYDSIDPVFKYYSVFPSQRDPIISVGGVSENFVEWTPGVTYTNGKIVKVREVYYRALKTHTSGESFDSRLWTKLPELPLVGTVQVFKRENFNKAKVRTLEYGTVFSDLQQLVDFIFGYESYLVDQGFDFNYYDAELLSSRNWTTSVKELAFWTTHNWAVGALISLSPSSNKVVINTKVGVAENLLDGFYDYQVVQSDGTILPVEAINVNRSFQKITIDTVEAIDAISLFKTHIVLKEHVTVFSDRTVFNDVLYDKPTGYRQMRVKSRGFRTVDWDGDYTSPGFLYDNVKIESWKPYVDYKLGDIVSYRSYYYTSLINQQGSLDFIDANWSRLDVIPNKQLISNFDFKANQFEDYYNVDSDGVGGSQRELARHAVGYQTRDYLQELSEDEVTQFKLYQGFLKEKGTANPIVKVFDKLSKSGKDSVTLKEEWAFNVGSLGGLSQVKQIEFEISKDNLLINPQPLLVVDGSISNIISDRFLRINQNNFTISPVPYTKNIFTKKKLNDKPRSAGYVNLNDINHVLKEKNDLLTYDIKNIKDNDHIWLTFEQSAWDVLRFNVSESFIVQSAIKDKTLVTVTLNRPHNFNVDDIIGIKDIENLTGFYKITSAGISSFVVTVPLANKDPIYDESSLAYNICLLSPARFAKFSDIDPNTAALYKNGAKLWIDDAYSDKDKWQVIEKQVQYNSKDINDVLITDPVNFGSSVIYDNNHNLSIFGVSGSGYAISAAEFPDRLEARQILAPLAGYEGVVNNSFARSMGISPDSSWLAIGAPYASGVRSKYRGVWTPTKNYKLGDIVLFQGKLYKSLIDQALDGSTIDFINPEKWEVATLVSGDVTLELSYAGPSNQGMITLYKWTSGQWYPSTVLLSPRIKENELFGSKISISVSGSKYYMAVSAPGAVNGTGRVYLFVYENNQWKHLEDKNYKGIFDPTATYIAGNIVWFENRLWKAREDINTDNSTITFDFTQWLLVSTVSTQNSLPLQSSYQDDGSTVASGLLDDSTLFGDSTTTVGVIDPTQEAELVKLGDQFGSSIAMNRDGSILVVGAPFGDSQNFENYRGMWDSFQQYKTGDVVRHVDSLGISSYRQLVSANPDFVVTGLPPESSPWQVVGDSSRIPTGKVFVYRRNSNDYYSLVQTIDNSVFSEINDTNFNELIASGDQFGYDLDLDNSGYSLVISSPYSDINFVSKGAVYILRTTDLENPKYKIKQKIQSFEEFSNEMFGSGLSITEAGEKIVVGAKNAQFRQRTTFDQANTTFDGTATKFSENRGAAGQVYVYEKKDQTFFLVEKLDAELQDFESFGAAIDASESAIIVGSPDFKSVVNSQNLIVGQTYTIRDVGTTDWNSIGVSEETRPDTGVVFVATGQSAGTGTAISTNKRGKGRLFIKSANKKSWNVLQEEEDLIDISQIKNISVYDSNKNINLGSVDILDYYKFKISGVAEQELSFKTLFDPAVYTNGTEEQEVDENQAWFENHVGKLWWDLSTVKFLNYEQGDLAYRLGNWNSLAPFASIDIYEWVESSYTPAQWAEFADTTEGLALGISGQPKFSNNTVYSVKPIFNALTGELTSTKYYYWVKNKTVVPKNVPGRKISSADVSSLITNPQGSGKPFAAIVDSDKMLLWNFNSLLTSSNALINIEYNKGYENLIPIHREYQLLTEGVADSLPTAPLEEKWIDSLVGYDQAGNRVPDINLNEKQKYGISFRPRQSMFKNRFEVLRSVLTNINTILYSEAFADTINYRNLNLIDPVPSLVLNEYDIVVDTFADLETVGTNRVKVAILKATVVDGSIENIEIVEPGFGYRVVPNVVITGDGIGASAQVTIDGQGRIATVDIISAGKKYTNAIVQIRNFSVLVNQDETIKNYWAIYAWDDVRKVFIKRKIQAFNTTKYWKYVDWYDEGYSITSRIVDEIANFYLEPTINVKVGDIIRVKEYANGGWALLEKVSNVSQNTSGNYKLVGRENGTIEILIDFFLSETGLGFDTVSTFDGNVYDLQPTTELRNILKAAKDDIFINDLNVEWNKLFFTSIRYAFVQNPLVDWAFKTSFLNAIHDVSELLEKPSYKNDNLISFQKYIEEVKPYRTTIREYTSRYTKVDTSNSAVTDFDVPPVYSTTFGQIVPVNQNSNEINQYPWKWWNDNKGYEIVDIKISNAGSGYITPPTVLIEGSGTGAKAQAYISNGTVSGIQIINSGKGYLSAPTVRLVGGNGSSQNTAKAVAVLGNNLSRSITLTMKFDRVSKTGLLTYFRQNETFIAGSNSSVFELKYAPSRDKNKIIVKNQGRIVLDDEYFITYYQDSINSFSTLKAKLTFYSLPTPGNTIEVEYEKNDFYLDAVNRIEKYYSPEAGMIGKELPQLMTGIDFGGVQIQGTTFDVTGGWDALPWFTDNWDSVEPNSDYYYVADGSTVSVQLPRAPAPGEMISIYIKRNSLSSNPFNIDKLGPDNTPQYIINEADDQPKTIRIDDPYWDLYDGSTIQPNGRKVPTEDALMPTFIGDGSTRIIEFVDPITDQPYINVGAGDTLIFRPFTSDGSVVINDPNIVDTRISGGNFNSVNNVYTSAMGKTVDEIIIDGDKFISPDQVPAPEENVPGQVLESLSIKVYHSKVQGSAPIQSTVYTADGVTRDFDIGLRVVESKSIIVYIDKIKVYEGTINSGADYSINYIDNQITFETPPAEGSIIEIISIGAGGTALLDYQEFIADGETRLFLTKALFSQTNSVLVTVDGVEVNNVFFNSSQFTDTRDRTIVQLGSNPLARQVVKIICLGSGDPNTSLIRVNKQQIIHDGSTATYTLDNFVNFTKSSQTSSVLVELNGLELKGPDTVRAVYDGSNNSFVLGLDPLIQGGSITFNDVKVYINNILQPVITVYTFNTASKTIEVNEDYLTIGDEIKVIVDINSDYYVVQGSLTLSGTILNVINEGDLLEVTWFSDYPDFDIISDQYRGGQVIYPLRRKPLDGGYVWVYKQGVRLTKDKDFEVDVNRKTVNIRINSTLDEQIKIVEFGSNSWSPPNSYEIFKDMLNVYHYKRFSRNDVILEKDLMYYDDKIFVSDASKLFDPIPDRNIGGMVIINNERIEYLQKDGNVLSKLRRGNLGTAIKEIHSANSFVVDAGPAESIPYVDNQERFDFVSDGSSLIIGPLPYVPSKATRNNSWYRGVGESAIPENYGPCDQVEVFVAGTRMKKDPVSTYAEDLGFNSPGADVMVEADFSVDGESAYIRLTKAPSAGTRISVIRRYGRTWYDRGQDTASSGRTLQENNNPIVNFILQKTTIIPE